MLGGVSLATTAFTRFLLFLLYRHWKLQEPELYRSFWRELLHYEETLNLIPHFKHSDIAPRSLQPIEKKRAANPSIEAAGLSKETAEPQPPSLPTSKPQKAPPPQVIVE